MPQTDTRPAFRLPWTPERSDTDQPVDGESAEPPVDHPTTVEGEAPSMIDTTAGQATRRPTKFMADLSRAMQAAAEISRDETLARLNADVKTVVEEIRAASTDEAAALRRRADDDVAAVREWSKAEIARIRDEAEARVASRKTALDGEMDAYAKVVDARVEQVTATVSEFEARMGAFFERLLAEEDPTRIATMAETMPDPPDLAEVAASIAAPSPATFDPNAQVLPDAPVGDSPTDVGAQTTGADEADPVVSGPDFAAAEAEAAAFTGDPGDEDEPGPSTAEDDGTESVAPTGEMTAVEQATSRVVVNGLVSVASIATFKRSLGRTPGISAITVASGPDGEFVFTVNHDAGMSLADAIVALPGFQARITAETADGLEVAARDPDAAS